MNIIRAFGCPARTCAPDGLAVTPCTVLTMSLFSAITTQLVGLVSEGNILVICEVSDTFVTSYISVLIQSRAESL